MSSQPPNSAIGFIQIKLHSTKHLASITINGIDNVQRSKTVNSKESAQYLLHQQSSPNSSPNQTCNPHASSKKHTTSERIRLKLLLARRPKRLGRRKRILHILEIRNLALGIHLRARRPRRRDGLPQRIRRDLKNAPSSDVAAVAKNALDGKGAALPPEADAGEGVEESLGADFVAGAGPGQDGVQVWVVEGEGDVGCVEGDEGLEEVGVRVGLHVEDLEEDVEGGGRVVVRTGGGGEQVAFGEGLDRRGWLGQSAARTEQVQGPEPREQSWAYYHDGRACRVLAVRSREADGDGFS